MSTESPLGFRRAYIRGIPIDDTDLISLSAALLDAGARGIGGMVVTPNAYISRVLSTRNPGIDLDGLIAAPVDGKPLITLASIAGEGHFRRVTGVELLEQVLTESANLDMPIYVVGSGAPQVAEIANSGLRRRAVVGVDLPYASFDSPELLSAARSVLQEPGIVFICLGFPKQELLATRLLEEYPDSIFVGVGAAADIVSGRFKRAPRLFQAVGIEWIWRLTLEPRRLWRRYVMGDVPWVIVSIGWAISSRARKIGG